MKRHLLIAWCCCCLIAGSATASMGVVPETEITLSSPDNQVQFCFQQRKEAGRKTLHYEVKYKGSSLILPSRMGIEMENQAWESAMAYTSKVEPTKSWCDNLILQEVVYGEKNETWIPVYGERSSVKDNYNSATLFFVKPDESGYEMNIEVRAYNEGVAFRYTFPMHPNGVYNKITADLTEYTLPEATKAWGTEWAQGTYKEIAIADWKPGVAYERPLTLHLPDGRWVALADADVSNWCLLNFTRSAERPNSIATRMYETMDMVTPYSTPWKVIMTAETPGDLLSNNDLFLNLNPPCEIADTRWIKPGKIMRDTRLNTENAIACIDFCEQHNLQHLLFDAGWYGVVMDYSSDASRVTAPIDMKRVVDYGKEKGIGVWLYVNHHALEKQAQQIFPLFKEWGVAGVKFGFVPFKTHRWATWMHDLVRLAAENNLMVNIHDEYRPSGFSRTYPNLLTQEGIRGNEEFPDATHNTVLPFTRMLSGAGDYTICYYDKRLVTTHAHQLAASLIFYSPLQTLFWYDTPSKYGKEPEVEFFENLPAAFDDTKVISGEPGKSAVIARQKGEEWFIGAITNNEGSIENIPLNFLEKGQSYIARIYTDDESIATQTQVRCTYLQVDASQTLRFNLKPSGGVAIQLIPANGKALKLYKKYRGQLL